MSGDDVKFYCFPDEIIENMLKKKAKVKVVDRTTFLNDMTKYSDSVFLLRGITNYKYCHHLKNINSTYFYFDTGYFGNLTDYHQSKAFGKIFHRMVYNGLQMNTLDSYTDFRLKKIFNFIKRDFEVNPETLVRPWKKSGHKILICPPSKKVASVFKLDWDQWIEDTKKNIKKFSNRPIVVREKPEIRSDRVWGGNTIHDALDDDVFLLVTYNSIAATEAVIHGIPALTLGDNAASSVSIHKFKQIEEPVYPKRQNWLNNLGYGQFHVDEFVDGTVWDHLERTLKKERRDGAKKA